MERLHDVQPAVRRGSPGSCRLASTTRSFVENDALGFTLNAAAVTTSLTDTHPLAPSDIEGLDIIADFPRPQTCVIMVPINLYYTEHFSARAV